MYKNTTVEGWNDGLGFSANESLKLRRILIDILQNIKEWTAPNKTSTSPDVSFQRINFVKFVEEYDRRRDLNFLETFPEMKEFYRICKLETHVEVP
jgi:hypothetical protein